MLSATTPAEFGLYGIASIVQQKAWRIRFIVTGFYFALSTVVGIVVDLVTTKEKVRLCNMYPAKRVMKDRA